MKSNAQNFEQIGKAKPVTVTGSASVNQVMYTSFGMQHRRDPYSFVASGNLNFNFYGWDVPLSFTFSDRSHSFQQPFNQYSIHPTYKAWRAHLGYVSVSYSPYSVSGHNFLGAAIDYEPEGKIKFSALYGRFLKAVNYDSSSSGIPAYERLGYGVKAQISHDNSSLLVTLFHSADKDAFLGAIPDSSSIRPQENFVMSLGGSTLVFSKFLLRAEVAASAVTGDINSEKEKSDHVLGNFSPLYNTRLTTAFYNACKANLDYQQQTFTVGIGYERIAPGYKTFGAYYFNNDLENVTLNASTSLVDGKMSLTGSIGAQRDNLDHAKMSTLKRSVGSINVAVSPTEKISVAGSYSSFLTYTNIQSQFEQVNQLSPYENIDTLNFTQISRSGSLNASFAVGTDQNRRQTLNINASAQGASESQQNTEQPSATWFYNVNASYALNLLPRATTVSIALNGSMNDAANKAAMIGPVLSLSRSFFEKKLKANFSTSYFINEAGNTSVTKVLTSRLGSTISLKKKHRLNLNMSILNRGADSGNRKQITELTAVIGYSYSFTSTKSDR